MVTCLTTEIDGRVLTNEVFDPVTSTIADEESFNVAIGEAVDNGS